MLLLGYSIRGLENSQGPGGSMRHSASDGNSGHPESLRNRLGNFETKEPHRMVLELSSDPGTRCLFPLYNSLVRAMLSQPNAAPGAGLVFPTGL